MLTLDMINTSTSKEEKDAIISSFFDKLMKNAPVEMVQEVRERIDKVPDKYSVMNRVLKSMTTRNSDKYSICITHNDADGLGVAAVAALHSYITAPNEQLIVLHCGPDSTANAFFAFACICLLDETFASPNTIYIGDVQIDLNIVRIFRPIFKSTKWFYADHHYTNDMVQDRIVGESKSVINGKEYTLFDDTACLSSINPTCLWKPLEKKIADILCLSNITIYSYPISVSATLLMYAMLEDEISVYLKPLILEDVEVFVKSISQWDTFEWKSSENKKYNTGYEFVMPHVLSFASIDEATGYVIKNIRALVDGKISSLYTDDMLAACKYGDIIVSQMAEKMKASYCVIHTADALGMSILDKNMGQFPYCICVVEFPSAGNKSMIFHEFMNSDIYKNLEEQYGGSIALATVSMDCDIISFRSKLMINVAELAKMTGGGGHRNASATRNADLADKLRSAFIRHATKRE